MSIGLLAIVALSGCDVIADSGADEQTVNDGNPSPRPTSHADLQQAAHDEDPSTYCSPEEVSAHGWRSAPGEDRGFGYLPVFVGSQSDIESEMENESASSTYIEYSTSKILLAAASRGSDAVDPDEIEEVSVRQVTRVLKDGAPVQACAPASELEVEPIGQKTLTYFQDGVEYTKPWTVWELAGENFNPLPKDRNTVGFSADLTVDGEVIHVMLTNSLTKLPAGLAEPGDATDTPDPGMALIRDYYENHIWK